MRFRLVDRILSWESRKSICGLRAVPYADTALKAFAGDGLHLPESLLLEGFFQLGNWLITLTSDFTAMGLILRARSVTFDGLALPGDVVRMEAHIQSYRESGVLLSGVGHVDGRRVCTGTACIAGLVPLAEYVDPDEMRALYQEIYRPETV